MKISRWNCPRKKTMLSPLHNLQAFAVTRPPIVIFTACIAVFAVATLSLSYYLRSGPVKNPDISLDWNVMMDRIARRDMCVATESRTHHKPGTVARHVHTDVRDVLRVASSSPHSGRGVNDSVSVRLQLRLGSPIKQLHENVEMLVADVLLTDLGFPDKNDKILMMIDLTEKHSFVNCTQDGYCTVVPDVCVTFVGKTSVLPQTKDSKSCLLRQTKKTVATFSLLNYDESKNDDKSMVSSNCAGLVISQDFVDDPSLEEMLSYNEQTLMNLHLTYTSYFLFVMVITVLCYAVVRGQTNKPKMISLDKAACV